MPIMMNALGTGKVVGRSTFEFLGRFSGLQPLRLGNSERSSREKAPPHFGRTPRRGTDRPLGVGHKWAEGRAKGEALRSGSQLKAFKKQPMALQYVTVGMFSLDGAYFISPL